MSKRRLVILSFFLICIVLIVGVLWYLESEKITEQKLQDYIGRLEDSGFTIEERALADFHVNGSVRIHFFGDFRSYAEQEGVNHIYYDRGIHALYFLRPTGSGIEANIFYYK